MERLSRRIGPALRWIYGHPRYFAMSTDSALWVIGFTIAAALRLLNSTPLEPLQLAIAAGAAIATQIAIGTVTGVYRSRWRVTSFEEVSTVAITWTSAAVVAILAAQLLSTPILKAPRFSTIIATIMAGHGMFLARAVWRHVWSLHRRPEPNGRKRTIILGAGEGGEQMVKAMLADPDSTYYPIALLDDDPALCNRQIGNVAVEGTRRDLARVAARHQAEVLLVAIAGANSRLIQEASTLAAEAGLEIRVLPATSELVKKMTIADVRPPTVDDLLGRDPVEIDLESVSDYIRGKRILITGAGGSIGSELSRQVSQFMPASLCLLDRDESALHGLQLTMEGRALLDSDQLVVADIRDRERVFEVFEHHKPEVVFHTAALKHLTLLENQPQEGVKTNVYGSKNLLDAAKKHGVGRFVNISTDKAADPTSVLGATKLAAERLTGLAANEQAEAYLSVRFGNVLGSRGSVLPTFMDQIEKGNNLTVTDPEATRFFMTIPEAVRLVVQAGAIGDPGEVLILDMGEPVKILDLANQLIQLLNPSLTVEFTGLRPGEKLHEILIATDEVGAAKIHPRIIHTATELADPADALATMGPEAVRMARDRLAETQSTVR